MKATKTKTATALNNKIKRLNAKYRKATPAQRRVMIAKDALKQIEVGQINPESGIYVRLHQNLDINDGTPMDYDTPLQPVLLEEGKDGNNATCNCCAKGALFISCVRLSNKYNGDPTGIGSRDINMTVDWPYGNYDLIEEAFESSPGDWWYDRYEDDADRLKAILKNIIRNRGTFKFNG